MIDIAMILENVRESMMCVSKRGYETEKSKCVRLLCKHGGQGSSCEGMVYMNVVIEINVNHSRLTFARHGHVG